MRINLRMDLSLLVELPLFRVAGETARWLDTTAALASEVSRTSLLRLQMNVKRCDTQDCSSVDRIIQAVPGSPSNSYPNGRRTKPSVAPFREARGRTTRTGPQRHLRALVQ